MSPQWKPSYGPRRHVREIRERLQSLRFDHFEARLKSPCLGAEIRGVDLSQPLSESLARELNRALVEFKVLFFREQDLTPEAHVAFAKHFGELEVHPFLPEGDVPELIRFAKDEEVVGVENIWHSDVSWREIPSLGSVLRAHEVPEVGGDTLWVDMEAVYAGLSESLKKEIEGKYAIHDFVHTFGIGLSEEERAEKRKQFPPARHPMVRTHPISGRRCVYVNAIFTHHVDGLPKEESDDLLDRLHREVDVPEYQVRFHWEPDSIAFWDNRSTQHLAASDYWPQKRVMERLTIIGDRPF
jgi:taurine dioxygenase